MASYLRRIVLRGRHFTFHCAVPAGLWGERRALLVRRLKPTVNNMPSLRDLLTLIEERLDIIIHYLFFVPKKSWWKILLYKIFLQT